MIINAPDPYGLEYAVRTVNYCLEYDLRIEQ